MPKIHGRVVSVSPDGCEILNLDTGTVVMLYYPPIIPSHMQVSLEACGYVVTSSAIEGIYLGEYHADALDYNNHVHQVLSDEQISKMELTHKQKDDIRDIDTGIARDRDHWRG